LEINSLGLKQQEPNWNVWQEPSNSE